VETQASPHPSTDVSGGRGVTWGRKLVHGVKLHFLGGVEGNMVIISSAAERLSSK